MKTGHLSSVSYFLEQLVHRKSLPLNARQLSYFQKFWWWILFESVLEIHLMQHKPDHSSPRIYWFHQRTLMDLWNMSSVYNAVSSPVYLSRCLSIPFITVFYNFVQDKSQTCWSVVSQVSSRPFLKAKKNPCCGFIFLTFHSIQWLQSSFQSFGNPQCRICIVTTVYDKSGTERIIFLMLLRRQLEFCLKTHSFSHDIAEEVRSCPFLHTNASKGNEMFHCFITWRGNKR